MPNSLATQTKQATIEGSIDRVLNGFGFLLLLIVGATCLHLGAWPMTVLIVMLGVGSYQGEPYFKPYAGLGLLCLTAWGLHSAFPDWRSTDAEYNAIEERGLRP